MKLTDEQRAGGWTASDEPGGYDDRLRAARFLFVAGDMEAGLAVLMGATPASRLALEANHDQ